MASNPLIAVDKKTKRFLEEEKKRLEEALGREPTFDEVLKVRIPEIDRDFRRILEGRMDNDDDGEDPFLL